MADPNHSAPPASVLPVLVEALELSQDLSALLSEALEHTDSPGGAAVRHGQRIREGLERGVLTESGGHLAVADWVRQACADEPSLAQDLVALQVHTPSVQAAVSRRLSRLFASGCSAFIVVCPQDSLSAAHAGSAIEDLGLAAVHLDAEQVTLRDLVGRILPFLDAQSTLFGFGFTLAVTHEVARDPAFQQRVQRMGRPAVVLVYGEEHDVRGVLPVVRAGHSSVSERSELWRLLVDHPRGTSSHTSPTPLKRLAALPLNPQEMSRALGRARTAAVASGKEVTEEGLRGEGWRELTAGLSGLARIREAQVRLHELVYPSETEAQVDQVLRACHTLLGRPRESRPGLRMLFSGKSGTGKTAVVEAMGAELELPLMFVDTSRIVDKYIGETEKNLDKVLAEAERAGALLVFDEGESLFGSRGAGADPSGAVRGANRQTAYLLSRIEQHRGLVVVISNFPGAIDGAFLRRFHFSITFPVPEGDDRVRLWKALSDRHGLSGATPQRWRDYELSGGNVDSVCFLASLLHQPGEDINELLDVLVEREYARLGRRLPGRRVDVP